MKRDLLAIDISKSMHGATGINPDTLTMIWECIWDQIPQMTTATDLSDWLLPKAEEMDFKMLAHHITAQIDKMEFESKHDNEADFSGPTSETYKYNEND